MGRLYEETRAYERGQISGRPMRESRYNSLVIQLASYFLARSLALSPPSSYI